MVQFEIFGSICKIEPARGVLRQTYTPLYRSTDPSTSSGCSAVHGEPVEPSRRSPLFLEGKLYKFVLV